MCVCVKLGSLKRLDICSHSKTVIEERVQVVLFVCSLLLWFVCFVLFFDCVPCQNANL